jgi:TetR/AcrR family transcriptional regulator, transcriptional repressor for nem operon
VLAVIGDFAVRLAPHDPQSAHAKVLSIYAVMIGAMQLSRALADRQLADEILEQGIRNVLTLVHAEGEASGYRSTIRDTRPGEPTDANATRRPPA